MPYPFLALKQISLFWGLTHFWLIKKIRVFGWLTHFWLVKKLVVFLGAYPFLALLKK